MDISMTGITITRYGIALVALGHSSGGLPGSLRTLVWKTGEPEKSLLLKVRLDFRNGQGTLEASGPAVAGPHLEGGSVRPLGGNLTLREGSGVFQSRIGWLRARGMADTRRRVARIDYEGEVCLAEPRPSRQPA
jgi:hypothetical protein